MTQPSAPPRMITEDSEAVMNGSADCLELWVTARCLNN